jgi:hypothetical protein
MQLKCAKTWHCFDRMNVVSPSYVGKKPHLLGLYVCGSKYTIVIQL